MLNIYDVSKKLPREERYGLTSQLRRAAASIAANIAEGCGKEGERDFARYLGIAAGSTSETEYHLILAHDLQYLEKKEHINLQNQITEIKKMLNSFIKKLTANS